MVLTPKTTTIMETTPTVNRLSAGWILHEHPKHAAETGDFGHVENAILRG